MNSNKMQIEEIPLTVDVVLDVAINAWNEIKTSKLSFRFVAKSKTYLWAPPQLDFVTK